MTAFLILSLLFFAAGALSIFYNRLVPNGASLRQRFPNRITFTGLMLWALVIAASWYLVIHTSGFVRVASITTMLFFLLAFETIFLLMIRAVRRNVPASLLSLGLALIPFLIQYFSPTFLVMNIVIVVATMGATTLIMKLDYLRTKTIMIMAVLFTVNDVLNVRYLIPKLHLVPVTEPMRLLIFPTVTVGAHVVGSGDFMYLVLLTLVMLRDFGARSAFLFVAAESVGLFLTGLYVTRHDVLLPFLTVMTPIFIGAYIVSYTKKPRQGGDQHLASRPLP